MKAIIYIFISISPLTFVYAAPVEKPKIQKDEFTVFFKEKYHVFKVLKYGKLKLSENCFKNINNNPKKRSSTPNCQAFDVAKIKVKDLALKKGAGTHPASLHCSRMMGENLIAYDHLNSEYDYCRFPDDSLVSSWSMFNNAYQGSKK